MTWDSIVSQIAGIAALKTKISWLPTVVEAHGKSSIIKDAVDKIRGAYLPLSFTGKHVVIDISAQARS